MFRVVVLISGSGSNLRALLNRATQQDSAFKIVAVGSDRQAKGFSHADDFQIPTFSVSIKDFETRESWGAEFAKEIAHYKPDLVVAAGLMRLLPKNFVEQFSPNLINTHPSALPDFPGAHAVRDALAAEAETTGVTVFIIDEGIDTGVIIGQKLLKILPNDTEETLQERIKEIERPLLCDLVSEIAQGKIDLTQLAASE